MTTGQVAPTHDRASCTDGKGNLSQAIPDTTTEITSQRIHTKTLSGERSVWECVISLTQTFLSEYSDEYKWKSPNKEFRNPPMGKFQLPNEFVSITENTTEITNQRIHTDTLSGERAVRECFLHHSKSLRIS